MRIALISDIHFGKDAVNNEFSFTGEPLILAETKHAKPLFSGMIDILKRENPEYLFVAGDLTSAGNPLEFKYCDAKIAELAKNLDICLDNVILCIGNHDLDWRISDLKEVDRNAYQKEDADFLANFYQRLSNIIPDEVGLSKKMPTTICSKFSIPYTYVAEYEDFIVFVLNSSHKSARDQKYKHGCLAEDQFTWFSESARKYKDTQKKKIVLLHHHPANYPFPLPTLDISTLEEGAEIIKVCGENGIDLVIHGHRHQPQAKTVFENGWIKPVTFICSGSISVNAQGRTYGIPNTFHLIDFERPAHILLKNYYYTEVEGWKPVKYCQATPVDGEMLLGKMITSEDAEDIIKQLPENIEIPFNSLSEELYYLPLNKTMELVKQLHPDCTVYGEFPESIFIFNKGRMANG